MSDLLRCPFCGNLPKTEVRVTQMGYGEDHIVFSIVCGECGVNKCVRLKIKNATDFMTVDQAMEKVHDAWNHREYVPDEAEQ